MYCSVPVLSAVAAVLADETGSETTQYAILAVFTLCALLTLVTFILWRKAPGDAEPLESRESGSSR